MISFPTSAIFNQIRYILLLTLLFSSRFATHGQNLVPNGDFEGYNACPIGSGSISYDLTYTSFPFIKSWVTPTSGTSDYYNSCSPSSFLSVPSNLFGYQQAHSGNAYVGFYSNISYANSPNRASREYLMTKLNSPLVHDSVYCVRFFVSPTIYPSGGVFRNISVKEVGLHFSDTIPLVDAAGMLDIPYHVVNDTNQVLSDTSLWYEVNGTYTAKGGEQWMLLGNFGGSFLPPHTYLSGPAASGTVGIIGYDYVDDISVLPTVRHDSIQHLMLCESVLALTSPMSAGPYLWSTGDTSRTIYVRDSGSYRCRTIRQCDVYNNFFRVDLPPAYDSVHSDIVVCDTSKTDVVLTAAQPGGSYSWSTGDTTQSIRVASPGAYSCVTKKDCKIFKDYFRVIPGNTSPPVVRDTVICQYTLAPLLAVPDTGLVWYTQPSSGTGRTVQPAISTAATGTITLYVASQRGDCISKRVPIHITIKDKPASHIPQTITRCNDAAQIAYLFGIQMAPDVRYEWNRGDTDCCIRPAADGQYIRIAGNSCGSVSDTFTIQSEPCTRCIAFPDAFTPNGDRLNDVFRPLIRCAVRDFRMRIYNRWGEAVYVSEDQNGHWDGRQKGVPAPTGTYMYYASFTSVLDGKSALVEGALTLVR